MPRSIARDPTLIDDSAQDREQFGNPVKFVDHHELAGLCTQERIGILEPTPIHGSFEIQIDGGSFMNSRMFS
jgi:hypothetical protein